MKGFTFSSLKTRLYLLVLVTLFPFLGLILYNASEQRRIELKAVEKNALSLAETAADSEAQLVEGARQMLIAVGNFLITSDFDSKACNLFCTDLLRQFIRYTNIGAIWPDGKVFCSAVPQESEVDAADRAWLNRAFTSQDVVIGSFHSGRIEGKPILVTARAVFGTQGNPVAVMFAAIDRNWMNRLTSGLTSRLPEGATLHQIDGDGVLTSYRTETHSWQDGSIADPKLIQAILSKKRGIIEAPDGKDSSLIHSFAPLSSALKDRDVVMVLSIPRTVVFAHSRQLLVHNLSLLGGVLVLSLILARFAGNYFVLKQVATLVDASRRLAAGDLTTRIGFVRSTGELGQLAGAFDEMAAALQLHADEQKKAEAELRESREQLRSLAVHIQTVREEERKRIARDIHDNLGQALTALKMDVSWLERKASENNSLMLTKTKSMNALIEETIHAVQRISAELRPGILDDFGLTAAIEWQAEEFQERTGIKTKLHLPEYAIDASKDQSTAVFRIFQEALTNVIRHAGASAVEVILEKKNGKLCLTIMDNGRGIAEEEITHPKSFGLIGMHERVYPWGGTVRVRGIPNQGTALTVTIPLAEEGKSHD